VVGFLRASHPEPSAAVTAITALLALAVGHGWAGVLVVTGAIAASQLAIGWHNDWLDAERDTAAGRTDKPIPSGSISRRAVGIGALVAAVATVPIALPAGVPAGLAIGVALAGGLLYNWPLKATPLSVVPYAVSFGLLPSFVVLALPGAPAPPLWLPLAGGLLGAGAHFANVLPDLADDADAGIRGLPHILGPFWSRLAAAALLLAATAVLAFGPPGAPSWLGLAAVALAVAVLPAGWYADRRARARNARATGAFRAVLLVALIDVGLMVALGRLV
jgi:4-hydroxybenzoate polyprenyltransferase